MALQCFQASGFGLALEDIERNVEAKLVWTFRMRQGGLKAGGQSSKSFAPMT